MTKNRNQYLLDNSNAVQDNQDILNEQYFQENHNKIYKLLVFTAGVAYAV